jgi:hypothetical protein
MKEDKGIAQGLLPEDVRKHSAMVNGEGVKVKLLFLPAVLATTVAGTLLPNSLSAVSPSKY